MSNKVDKTIKMITDSEILAEFIKIYCDDFHGDMKQEPVVSGGTVGRCIESIRHPYCEECRRLLLHAVSKRVLCPFDPKPSCKKCPSHCYGPGYRDTIREVMRYSGMQLIKRGRFSLMKKYFS
jgi:hypothetical protein